MAQFCEQGDTARVTFPDLSVIDFTDTPINIDFAAVCRDYYQVSYRVTAVTQDNEILNINQNGNFRFPFGGFRINPNQPDNWQYLGIGTYPYQDCMPYEWRSIGTLTLTTITAITIISSSLIANWNTAPFTIRITNLQGDLLFTQQYNNKNYSVQCLQGCPPNTLDCGDCCLPCDEIFNSVSDIRRLVAGLK
jgi:hypothetical protein